MRHAAPAATLGLLALLAAGCIGFPLGRAGLEPQQPATAAGLDRPVVFTGEVAVEAGRLGWRVAEAALASARTRAHRLLAPLLPGSFHLPAAHRLRALDPTDPAAYAAVASRLPPHYLGRFRLVLDATGLPDEERLRAIARGHALFGMLLSPLPVHRIRLAATCELELFRAQGGGEELLDSVALAGERRLVGNVWWLQGSYREAARHALAALALECAGAIRREALARLEPAVPAAVRLRGGPRPRRARGPDA